MVWLLAKPLFRSTEVSEMSDKHVGISQIWGCQMCGRNSKDVQTRGLTSIVEFGRRAQLTRVGVTHVLDQVICETHGTRGRLHGPKAL